MLRSTEQNPELSIVTLNIEGKKHLGVVLEYLQRLDPDVVLIQEVFEEDLPKISGALNMNAFFSPLCVLNLWDQEPSNARGWGIAALSRFSLKSGRSRFFFSAKITTSIFATSS